MTRLWYDTLDARWRAGPMTLAGVTAPEGLFVLETLASDQGMRVVYRGLHARSGAGSEVHSLRGPAVVLQAFAAGGTLAPWGTPLCAALSSCPAVAEPLLQVSRYRARAPADVMPAEGGTRELASWIIAPRGTATPAPAA